MSSVVAMGRSMCSGLRENVRELKKTSSQMVQPLRENSQTGHAMSKKGKQALIIAAIALTVLLAAGAMAGLAVGGFFVGAAIGGTVGILAIPTSVAFTFLGLKLGILAAIGIGILGVKLINKID